MRILVTGGAGFIGSHLCDRLIAHGHIVAALDNFNDFYDPALKRRNIRQLLQNPNFTLFEGDICDSSFVNETFKTFAPDRLVHLAAWAGVRPSIERPELYQRVNVEGTTTLLEACRHHGVMHLVFASSSSVYGDRETVPFRETDCVDFPISPYAATKKAGELLCYTWHHLFGINAYCMRFFTVYGPRQRPEMAIHKFARQMLLGQPVTMFGDGSQSRDYTYIDDIIDGVEAAVNRVNGYEIINIGESKTCRLDELISMIGEALNCTPTIHRAPLAPGDVTRTFADVSKAAELLDYKPKFHMKQGIARFAEWLREEGLYGLKK